MRRIAELADQSLTWQQPAALKMEYELRTDSGDLPATLRFRSSFGSFATAETAEGCWTFKRVGFWQTRVTVRPCGSDAEIALFKNNTWRGGGTLEFADGRKLQATTNFWQSKLGFETESGETLVEFGSGGLLHLSISVEIHSNAVSMPELPLIVTLGCYLIVMMRADAAVGASV